MENDYFISMIEIALNNFEPSTQVTYLGELNIFAKFLGPKKLSEATTVDGYDYLGFVQKQTWGGSPLANKTIKRKFDSLVTMYDAALDFGGARENPFGRVIKMVRRLKRQHKRPPTKVDFSEVIKILEKTHSVRDRAIFAILFGGGLRRSELVRLKRSDVTVLQGGSLGLRVKTSKLKVVKYRPVTLPIWASEHLRKHIDQMPGCLEFLFSSLRSGQEQPLSGKYISEICFQNFGKRAHTCRYTHISYLLSKGVPVPDVARAVGHEHITSTMMYDLRSLTFEDCASQGADYLN